MTVAELGRRSRFVYGAIGSQTDWTTTLPTRFWTRRTKVLGGSRTAGGGTPAAYVPRRDYNIEVPLRLYESEVPDLTALLEWAQDGAESFTWYPDASDTGTSYEVYLEGPLAGGEWEETREQGFERVVGVPILLRRVDGYAWDLNYLEDS